MTITQPASQPAAAPAGGAAPDTARGLTVFELFHGGDGFDRRRVGLFVDVPAAQRGAAEEFSSWLDTMSDMSTAEVLEDTEIIATELVWADEQHYLRGRMDIPVGDPVPTAHYSPGRFFTIQPVPVRR